LKKVLIIAPYFPPSNLAGVHRSRLFAQHLPEFGWEPVVLAIHEKYYEEQLDYNLVKLLPENLRIEKVNAFGITKPRLIGDIGLRGFFQLYKRAKELIRKENIEFLYIPIPPFYTALLGRLLHNATGIKYGIDYIDPWVNAGDGKAKLFSRFGLSSIVAKLLEPVAVKKAALITGVAEGYYKGVQDRNPKLLTSGLFGAMPYGGEAADHEAVKQMDRTAYLFTRKEGKIQLVYAGAMLPQAYKPLEAIFTAIQQHPESFKNVEIHFVGTGKTADDPEGYNIKPCAEKYGLWQTVIFEYPKRIPYLDVLLHLDAADGIFILGSTEPHYTPSKVFQGVLSGKPIMAVLHYESTALKVVNTTKAGLCYPLYPADMQKLTDEFPGFYKRYHDFFETFNVSQVDYKQFEQYSARSVTAALAKLLDKINA
jgi:hypothetical protein